MKRRFAAACLLTLWLAAGIFAAAGCAEEPIVGAIDDDATVAVIRLEAQENGISGVVYRRINRFSAFLAASDMPVLVVFYSPLAPINALIIPRLEQMADDYREQLQIVWIDASAESALSASFSASTLPQFTMVVEGSLKRSLVGYDDQGAVKLQNLIEPYLSHP
ncbi:MAG: thioredoxin domain-containing protein [Clostridiaceae bacterium]|nr:thioredoxin domain-containing protein [Clostridiaceae bacterium]